MEYEISDEDRLFDDSTNPSLKHEPEVRKAPTIKRQVDSDDKRKLQKAELIPEEEQAA